MKAIEIRSLRRPGGSRRAGRRFGPEPQCFAPDFFKKEQLEAIDEDPQLAVRQVDVKPTEVNVIGVKAAESSKPASKAGGKEDDGGDGKDPAGGKESPAK